MAKNYSKRFIVSVCDAYANDPVTGEGVFNARVNISSAFNVTMTATDVRGGKGNQLVYKYMHDRTLTIELVSATFNEKFLALNVGSAIKDMTNLTVLTTECANFTAGVATMTGTAIGKVAVNFENGLVENVTPATKTVTLSDTTYNGSATLTYNTAVASGARQIAVDTAVAPSVVSLTLVVDVVDADGKKTDTMNINVPRLQIEGNYELSFASDGVSQDTISGSALAVSGKTCEEGDAYAYINFIPVATVTTP